MNKQTKEQLRAVLEDEEKTAAFAQKILETIDTDDESYEDIGNSVIYALLNNDAEGLLIALCGWSAESLLNPMETDLRIRKENFEAALSAVKAAFSSIWTEHLDTFEEAMSDFGYDPEYDEDGNIDGFEFIGEKLRNDREFWDTVVPYVEEGCYLEVEGDDLEIWRWKFRNGKVIVQYPTFLWDDDEEESCETAT